MAVSRFNYAETHFRFKIPFSRLYRRWPEAFLDAPYQVLPGKEISIYLLVKDAHRFPITLKSLKLTAWDESGSKFEQEFEFNVKCDQNLYHHAIKLPRYNFKGIVRVKGDWTIENAQGLETQFSNHNFPGLEPGFLEINLLEHSLPYPQDWKSGEMHCHSEFSSDPVEFGAPLSRMQEVAEAIGLDFVLCTDHSYDFYYHRDQYLQACDPIANFKEYQNQTYSLNTLRPSFPTIVPGEEVSCGNTQGQNVHLLVFGHAHFLPGLGDGGRRGFNNKPDLQLDEVLHALGETPAFAAHPKAKIGWLERIIFRRGVWADEDLKSVHFGTKSSPLCGLQFWNGNMGSDYRAGKEFWIQQLQKGLPLLPIGANDAHGDFNQNIGVRTPLFSLYQGRSHIFGRVKTLIPSTSKDIPSLQSAFKHNRCICTDGPFIDLHLESNHFRVQANSNSDMGTFSSIIVFGSQQGETKESILFEHYSKTGSMDFEKQIPIPKSGYVRAEAVTHKGQRAKTSALFFAIMLLTFSTLCFSAPVEVSHPVSHFLRRLEEKGIVSPGFYNSLPRDASEISSVLKSAEANENLLPMWDRRRLHRYLQEFDAKNRWENTRLHYGDSTFNLLGRVEYFTAGSYRDSLPNTVGYAFGSFSPSVTATYQEKLYLVSTGSLSSERSSTPRFVENYDPQRGLTYNTNRAGKIGIPQGVSTFDGYRTVSGFGNHFILIELGQDWNQWGPGYWQHATLSAKPFFWNADSLGRGDSTGFIGSAYLIDGGFRRGYRYPGEGPPLPQIRLRIGFGRWEYTKIVAERKGLWKDSSASLIAHRLQVRLGSAFTLGFTEMLAIGTVGPDWAAFLPAVPLKFAEHSGNDLGNIAIAADIEWVWLGHGRIYSEFYVDDYSGPPFEFWGNKFAFMLGASFQDPFGFPSEFHLELAHVDPWVFQHNRHNTQMQSNGSLLGSILPPNSEAIFSSLTFPLPREFTGELGWQFRQRDRGSQGSSIFDVHGPNGNPNKEVLANLLEIRNYGFATVQYEWKRYLQVKASIGGLWIDGWQGKVGKNFFTPVLAGEFFLRY